MKLELSPEDKKFREEVRDWLERHKPARERPNHGSAMREFDLDWVRIQSEGGWSGVSWPKSHGGCGLSDIRQMIWHEEYARAQAPHVGVSMVGINFGGPTLILHGTEKQQKFHLPKILKGETVWCQGFSEPGAGSDLAGVRTKGVVDGNELIVTGQKIWTSYAHLADYQILLLRTDPHAPKHRGLTMVICDMKSAGIDIRPIQIMSGEIHFCEVFYDEVRIPLENVIGSINSGWQVALATLAFERGAAFISDQVALAQKVKAVKELAHTSLGPDGVRKAIEHDDIARELATLQVQVAGMRALTYTNLSRTVRTGKPGPEGSMMKLYFSQIGQVLNRLNFRILGAKGLEFAYGDTGWVHDYLYSYAASIGGGTTEIQREIIADHVLKMPRSR